MTDAQSHELLRDYREGDESAATAIFDRYVARLQALSRSRLGEILRRRVDPEDVVQSAFRSFFFRARTDEFGVRAAGDLWRVLAAITLHKLHSQVDTHTAQKRSVRREKSDASELLTQAEEPTPADVAAVVEEFHLALKRLSPMEQRALSLELEGTSLEDISRTLGKSERSTRRYLADAREKIEKRLLLAREPQQQVDAVPQASLRYADYQLETMLAAGGMGKVYRATEKASGNSVALKSLHKSHLADARAVQRFVQESQILARLTHPNIVGTRGLGRYPGGGFFIVMELIDGVDLESERQLRRFSASEVVSIVRQVVAAIQHAHCRGIVHCDVKPANILLDPSGHVFVTDFGFAHFLTPSASARGVGGTRGYTAPEVLDGAEPTRAADIYAIGVLLRVLLTGSITGELPLDADGRSRALENIWMRCLQSEPSARYATASELLAMLDRIDDVAASP